MEVCGNAVKIGISVVSITVLLKMSYESTIKIVLLSFSAINIKETLTKD